MVAVPSFVSRFIHAYKAQGDVENGKGLHSTTTTEVSRSTPSPMPFTTRERDARVQELLSDFRHHVGIQNEAEFSVGRVVANKGIYTRVVEGEAKYAKAFKLYSALINSALGLQIVFAAALTALGAGNGPRSAVTAFGALNTIIAGFLTYLKGSGLPNRYKYYQGEMTKVREYIEGREREFSRGLADVDLRHEVLTIEEMYNAVKNDIETNTPEAFISRTKGMGGARSMDGDLIASRARSQYGDTMSYADEKMRSIRPGLESRLSGFGQSIESRLKAETQNMRNIADGRLRDTQSGLNDRVTGAQRYLSTHLDETRHGAESSYNQARSGAEERINYARATTSDSLNHARVATAAQVDDTRHNLEARIDETRTGLTSQVENTRHDLESQLADTRGGINAQVEDTRHEMQSGIEQMQAQARATEEKVMGIAENIAQKVLSVTQSRHKPEDPK